LTAVFLSLLEQLHVPNSGVVSILAHAQMIMGEVLAAENKRVGVHTVVLRSIIATRARKKAGPSWITAREVGEPAHGYSPRKGD
jgi:hypothetical protein